MKIFIDAAGDDGLGSSNLASSRYTLGLVIFPANHSSQRIDDVFSNFQEVHLQTLNQKVKTELKWHKLGDRSRELVAKNLLSDNRFSKIVISADKLSSQSGWANSGLNVKQFRTYLLRSMLWLVCSIANLNSHRSDTIHLEFDKDLAELVQAQLHREASRIPNKKITMSVGVDSRKSLGIQFADCLAGSFNHYKQGRSDYYAAFRPWVCEVELVIGLEDARPQIKQVMRINDLKNLLFF